MNPLTLVKRIQKLNSSEAALGISDEASWHAKYKDSAYIFVGGISFDLTEGDLLAVFAQYGEIVDVNLVRDKGTGKSKGFAFLAYEDQRSTNLAVDNLNGAQILGRTVRVDHVGKYKKMEEEDEETLQKKREERGICRAFQRGECNRGAGCKFSHDERRAANTGWGHEDHKSLRWGHDKFESSRSQKQSGQSIHHGESVTRENSKFVEKDALSSRRDFEGSRDDHYKRNELRGKELEISVQKRQLEGMEREMSRRGDGDRQAAENRSTRHDLVKISGEDRRDEKRLRTRDFEQISKENRTEEKRLRTSDHHISTEEGRDERRSRRYELKPSHKDDHEDRRGDKRSSRDRDSSSHRFCETDEDQRYRSHR